MMVLRVMLGVLLMSALCIGAVQTGMILGLDNYWAGWFATAVLVAVIILIDPANRRGA